MIPFSILAWSAWSPRIAERDTWRAWACDPELPTGSGTPDVRFVPAMQRRRLSRLARMSMQAALDTCEPAQLQESGLVFASRHGELNSSIAMLREIAADAPLSPTAFSHSVHNAPAGQISIQVGHRAPASSVSAQCATFTAGLIDALALSHRRRGAPVLLVAADEPLPDEFQVFADEPQVAHAIALLVSLDAGLGGAKLRLASAPGEPESPRGLPEALSFLAWWLGSGEAWTSSDAASRWRLSREA